MILFHITGPPGGGKTYLCGILSKLLPPGYEAIDTNTWIQKDWSLKKLVKATHSPKTYERYLNSRISNLHNSNTRYVLFGTFVFVGFPNNKCKICAPKIN